MELREHLAREAGRVEEDLVAALDRLADDVPARLLEAMRYSLLGGGKRLRPVLCNWACAAVSGETSAASRRAGVALEMLHTYSLVHDDLPAMDDDDLRRGRPSCHRAFDEATAILAGDALHTQAFGELAALDDPALARDLAAWLARAAGASGMAGGQQMDLDATTQDVTGIHARKTGALLAAALCMGARAGGRPQADLDAVWNAGIELGVAFQIADDVLDQTATAQALGKSVGKDLAQGKQTALLDSSPEEALAGARERVATALAALREAGLGDERLAALGLYLVERDH